MIARTALILDRRGSAAAEMALVIPLLLAIMLGSMEIGNYFYNQHTLVKSVRDAARFAARQRMVNYTTCTGPVTAVEADTKTVARKGHLDSTANDLLPNWDSATFAVTMSCKPNLTDTTSGNSLVLGGIYANATGGAPSVVVSASLTYRPLLSGAFGFSGSGIALNATQQAAVMGL
ncbi:MAG: TadE family protein [Sphingomicrobium sp.]